MNNLEKRLGHQFKCKELFQRALTHKSYANEMKCSFEHNEKLEFLGDAVLDLVVGEVLFSLYPDDTEGGLSKKRASIVNEEVLSEVATSMGLNHLLRLGKGEMQTGGAAKPRLLASTFEALVGALYIDAGFEVSKAFLDKEFAVRIESLKSCEDFEKDYKTRLQEAVQKALKDTPKYEVVSEEGPPHCREFLVCVKINNSVSAEGRGRSKKTAEQMAAKNALEKFDKEIG